MANNLYIMKSEKITKLKAKQIIQEHYRMIAKDTSLEHIALQSYMMLNGKLKVRQNDAEDFMNFYNKNIESNKYVMNLESNGYAEL